MGALPDPTPPRGAQPLKSPDQAPPLFAVPGRSAPAPRREEPRPAPQAAPVPEVAEPVVEPDPAPAEPAPATPSPASEAGPVVETPQEGFVPVVGEPWWASLRPPDVWNTPAPTVGEEIARARRGDHLPQDGPWRTAELVRTWISALINTVLLLLVHVNRSAGRQAVLVLFVAGIALVLATR